MCSVTGATAMPRATRRVSSAGGERASGRGHLGAAGQVREDVLVRRERVAAVEVAVGDRAARAGRAACGGRPRPARATAGCRTRWGRSRRAGTARAGSPAARRRRSSRRAPRRARARRASGAVRSSTTQVSSSSRVAACSTIARPLRTASISPLTVAELLTTTRSPGASYVGQVGEPAVLDAVRSRHQQAHVVARPLPAELGRRRSGRLVGVVERDGRVLGRGPSCREHLGHGDVGRARRRPRGGRCSTSASRCGTTVSGSGRSEMSSPGKASWCIGVRMSPGSTAYVDRPVSSPKVSTRWSSAALEAPYAPQVS